MQRNKKANNKGTKNQLNENNNSTTNNNRTKVFNKREDDNENMSSSNKNHNDNSSNNDLTDGQNDTLEKKETLARTRNTRLKNTSNTRKTT